jgi:hypothetical protein
MTQENKSMSSLLTALPANALNNVPADVVNKITPNNLRGTAVAVQKGSLRLSRVSSKHYQLRDNNDIFVDDLKSPEEAFTTLCVMSTVERYLREASEAAGPYTETIWKDILPK